MANSYTQLYIQLIFSVKDRDSLIQEHIREELQKYITGIISSNKCKLLAIYANPDHIHILAAISPTISISDLVRNIKSNSSKRINELNLLSGHFNWQDGYGAFTYSQSQIDSVVRYIFDQPKHHKKYNFREEYLKFLKSFDTKYDEHYLFNWIDI